MPAMMTEQQLLAMREQILQDRAALPALLDAPEDKELRDALDSQLSAELGIIDTALAWTRRERPLAPAR